MAREKGKAHEPGDSGRRHADRDGNTGRRDNDDQHSIKIEPRKWADPKDEGPQ